MSNIKKKNWFLRHKILTGIIAIIILGSIESISSSNQTHQTTKPAITPTPGVLSQAQKAEVVKIVTDNTNHFQKLWQEGQTALGATQYSDGFAGLTALNTPGTPASNFSIYKQKENPGNDNSMNDALKEAEVYYSQSNAPDDNLNNWRLDMIQLSSDMGIWVNDATSWQIESVSTTKLNDDAQKVNQDFAVVQADINLIAK